MVPHPVNLQGFSLSYWLVASPVKSLTVLVGDSPQSPPFPRRLADERAYSPPSTVGGRSCDWLETSPGEEEEEEEEKGAGGLVEQQLFVCSTQAWARRGRRSPRYRADGAHKGRGGGPERSAAWPAAEAARAWARASQPPGEGSRGRPGRPRGGAEEVIGRAGAEPPLGEAAGFWLRPLGGTGVGTGAGEVHGRPWYSEPRGMEEGTGSGTRQPGRGSPFGRRCEGSALRPAPRVAEAGSPEAASVGGS